MPPVHPRLKARNARPKRFFSNNVPPGLHYLPPLDPKSEEFLELFRSFLTSNDERKTIIELSVEDGKVFIDLIDKAFRAARLDNELRGIAFGVLRKLCGKTGHLPGSYLLSDKFDLSGTPYASGGFSDVRMGVFKGKDVAVKSLRISELDNKDQIRKRFCKEVAMWKNLSHPNVLNLIGVPDTLEGGRFSMVSEWMTNGSIMEYVRKNSGNHVKLLADAVEGLRYLHHSMIVHGDLKGANILITNTNPVSARLADFGFMTIVYDPNLKMESSKSELGGGTTPFMAPELLVPSKFGLEKCSPTMEADVYAMSMVMYQVLTGALPFGKHTGPEVVFKVLGKERPSKPANALQLGLSDKVWKLLEDCWQQEWMLRPPVKEVSSRIKAAASACGVLSPVKDVAEQREAPVSGFNKFDNLFLDVVFDEEDVGSSSMERLPSQDSVTSLPDSLFSKLSETSEAEAESPVTEPALASTDALIAGKCSEGENTDDFPAFLFDSTPDYFSYHRQVPVDPVSGPSTPRSDYSAKPRPSRENTGPYRFAESNVSSRTLPGGVALHQPRDQPQSDTASTPAVVSQDREAHAEKLTGADLMDFSFVDVPDAAIVAMDMDRAKDGRMDRLTRPTSTSSLRSPRSRPIDPDSLSLQLDDNAKHKPRHSRFQIRKRLGRVLHQGDTHK